MEEKIALPLCTSTHDHIQIKQDNTTIPLGFLFPFSETSMQRCLILLREFSLTDGNNILIHTGLEFGPNHQTRYQDKSSSSSSQAEPVDVPLVDKLALEGVEASQLCK